jgi:hypothetical protein
VIKVAKRNDTRMRIAEGVLFEELGSVEDLC